MVNEFLLAPPKAGASCGVEDDFELVWLSQNLLKRYRRLESEDGMAFHLTPTQADLVCGGTQITPRVICAMHGEFMEGFGVYNLVIPRHRGRRSQVPYSVVDIWRLHGPSPARHVLLRHINDVRDKYDFRLTQIRIPNPTKEVCEWWQKRYFTLVGIDDSDNETFNFVSWKNREISNEEFYITPDQYDKWIDLLDDIGANWEIKYQPTLL